MSKIEVTVTDQVMAFTNMPVIASGDINVDRIKFTFDDNWDGYGSKICVFYQQKGEYYYGLLSLDNEVIIPNAVMRNEGNVYFGISACDGESVRTSNILVYEIVEGAYTEVDPEEGQDLIIQIQEKINEMYDKYNSVVDSLAHVRIEGDNEFEYEAQQIERLTNLEQTRPKIHVGEYTGTGESTSTHPNQIECPFPIKIMFIQGKFGMAIFINGINTVYYGVIDTSGNPAACLLDVNWSTDNKKVTWSASGYGTLSSPIAQLNELNQTYTYIILGGV